VVELKTVKTGKEKYSISSYIVMYFRIHKTYLQIQLLKIQPTDFTAQNRAKNQLLACLHAGDGWDACHQVFGNRRFYSYIKNISPVTVPTPDKLP
jgi:hypothetical protein